MGVSVQLGEKELKVHGRRKGTLFKEGSFAAVVKGK